MAKEQKSAHELAKLLREFSPELKDAKVSIISEKDNPHHWKVQLDESGGSSGQELERAWAHLAYEYELKT
jgi:hypothetical protein